jgi:hypothetical protein
MGCWLTNQQLHPACKTGFALSAHLIPAAFLEGRVRPEIMTLAQVQGWQ